MAYPGYALVLGEDLAVVQDKVKEAGGVGIGVGGV